MRILFFQYGDFGEAYCRLSKGGIETYRDQRSSVRFVENLSLEHSIATIGVCQRKHDEMLTNQLRSIGIGVDQIFSKRALVPILEDVAPDLFVCRTPIRVALAWAAGRSIPTLPCFADIFMSSSIRLRLRNWRTRQVLKAACFPCVANHGLTASQSLVSSLGISPARTVPWEFERLKPIGDAKSHAPGQSHFRLFYAGMLTKDKGVFDIIDVVSRLRRDGLDVSASLAGSGDTQKIQDRVDQLGVGGFVSMLGRIAASDVISKMREHDAVIVPSHHVYPEGIPNTIFESFASRTPLIASDHPAFVNRLNDGVDSLIFPAGNVLELAARIKLLLGDGKLYERISTATATALSSLYVGVDWTKLIELFLADPKNASGWVEEHSLESVNQRRAQVNQTAPG